MRPFNGGVLLVCSGDTSVSVEGGGYEGGDRRGRQICEAGVCLAGM